MKLDCFGIGQIITKIRYMGEDDEIEEEEIDSEIEELKEIHVEKMHFRVISRHPQYSIDTANRIFEEQRKDLYNIFKKYA